MRGESVAGGSNRAGARPGSAPAAGTGASDAEMPSQVTIRVATRIAQTPIDRRSVAAEQAVRPDIVPSCTRTTASRYRDIHDNKGLTRR